MHASLLWGQDLAACEHASLFWGQDLTEARKLERRDKE